MKSVQESCTGPELVPGVLRGYRTWHMDAGQLHGNFGQPWTASTMTAGCPIAERAGFDPRERHAAPDGACRCGIYGYYKPSALGTFVGLFGVVEASGRVLMGEYGFRAERARIVAIAAVMPSLFDELAEFMAAAMPDVAVFASRDQLLDEFPPDDVTALVGEVPDGAPVGAMFAWASARQFAAVQVQVRASSAEFEKGMRRLAETLSAFGTSIAEATRVLEPFLARMSNDPGIGPDEDPRKRALRLCQRRNTGPQQRYRGDGQRVTKRA